MSRVHMSLDIDVENEGQLAAVSKFFSELAKVAPQATEKRFSDISNAKDKSRGLITPKAQKMISEISVVEEEEPGKPSASEKTKEEPSKTSASSKKRSSKSASKKTSEESKKTSEGSKKTSSEESKPKSSESPSELTRNDLRELLDEKVDDHRAAIKAKLTELKAKNISTLDEAHFRAMYDFMNGLD